MENIYQSPQAELVDDNNNELVAETDYNPWFSMWIKPRATMRQILAGDPNRLVFLLAIVSGFVNALTNGSETAWESASVAYFIGAMVGGAISGFIGLLIVSALLRLVGGWLGGTGSWEHVRSAVAWSNVPTVWSLVVVLPLYFMSGDPSYYVAIIVGAVILIVVGVWQIVVFCKCVAQAHRFSAWTALLSAIIAALMVFVPVFLALWYFLD